LAGVLGSVVAAPEAYAPEVLEAIDRARGRSQIAQPSTHLITGYDVWHCYELSWLLTSGEFRYATGALIIPASSSNTVESKSLKLYLNSLNAHAFASDADAVACIERDLSALTKATVKLELQTFEALQKSSCLAEDVTPYYPGGQPSKRFTSVGFRSLCPVTSQPDWATLVIDVSEAQFDAEVISTCIESLRNHQGFHEQCVEDLYSRLERALGPDSLQVVGFFQRRGGIDITPWRSSIEISPSVARLFEQ
jgi:7-cyano-7-deazaguanine reductase